MNIFTLPIRLIFQPITSKCQFSGPHLDAVAYFVKPVHTTVQVAKKILHCGNFQVKNNSSYYRAIFRVTAV